ncbi:CDP-alcohol phosphatidyltransferase family protein [Bacteroides sp. 224]|uniref:CDP-alcohol phosphatidyltransferase family protein n=1 Tax=Bacteroides sp. 224 TaxID=2302936 RepID=UPI0013D82857|nr:CDP-alcohol phosphatidyltransferase family protein [Bacteroides sp. 224]NDV64590.1 CDP-alcohol phosphatidyltransferase family protein [Bacteroides sp. 224]
MKARDWAQQFIYKVIDPFVRGLIKIGVTPNVVTTIGFLLNVAAAGIFVYGAPYGSEGDYSYIGWGGFLILFAGLFDMLDGQVARIGKMSSKFGAMYDSVLDRYSEMVVLGGIIYYFMYNHFFVAGFISLVALVGSIMVSYIRARAEGLGIECKGGFMQRPERVVIMGVGALVCGICYHFAGFEEWVLWVFTASLLIVAIFSNITAIGRLNHSRRVMETQK